VPLTGRPDFVDNQEVSHAEALRFALADTPAKHALAVATGYINIGGLRLLASAVQDDRSTRLLLGAAPRPGLDAVLPALRFSEQLEMMRGERDFARFPPSRAAEMLKAVDAFLARDDVEVRRYTGQFLHGKAYLLGDVDDGRATLVSSANLTAAGMFANLELGLFNYDPAIASRALAWFDRLWESSVPYTEELRRLLFPPPPLVTPEDVYLRALLELYGKELFEVPQAPPPAASHLTLASFQRDGYVRARAILERHHGVIYADGVGTGKTEVGLALIEEYALRQGRHALVVCPAQLRAMWEKRIAAARLPAQVISYQELASDEQVADADRPSARRLHVTKDAYRLVIVDEAHAFRNADNTWYRAMTRLLGGERKDLVLLTATPVNNSLWDLFNLVMLFGRHDRALATAGIDSIRAEFLAAGANERDAHMLNPDRLFPLADAVSVRRDREFIVEHYPGATFPDGTPLRFPMPVLRTLRYDLDAAHPGLVDAVATAIGALTMARYRPSAYERGAIEIPRERTLAALLQSAVLKRFESCWAACLATLDKMIGVHRAFLEAWDAGNVPSLDSLRELAEAEWSEDGRGEWLDDVAGDSRSRPVADFEPVYREHVAADLDHLLLARQRLAQQAPDDDPKLAGLVEALRSTPGKVLVFATYGDTVGYIDDHPDQALGEPRERVVIIGGETDPDERTQLLARVCPDTVVEPGYTPPGGEVGLLLSTDVVSEGQNLQQAGTVISYDMPWNPQRVVQRNGRVIRLLSPHDEVQLITMLPVPGDLDQLLRLEAKITAKIAAAGVFGMESGVIEGDEAERRVYADLGDLAERLEAGDTSLLSEEDDAGGAFAGEELRAILLRAFTEGEVARLQALPWGVGAAFRQGPAVPSRGPVGIFFACRTTPASGDQRYWRMVTTSGDVITDELPLLRAISPGPAPAAEPVLDLEEAWQQAVADIVTEHNQRADPAFTEERLPPSQRWAVSLLRDFAVALPAGAEEADDLLSVPRSAAVRTALSDIQRQVVEGHLSRDQAAQAIVDTVGEYGLTRVEPPPPLAPITESDVGVVCWVQVLPYAAPPQPQSAGAAT
jgi:superfamily II DNA or RNA helicase